MLESNADTNLKSYRGNTPLHKAVLPSDNYQPNQVYDKLLENWAFVDAKNIQGKTPFDLCRSVNNNGEKVIIKTALEKHIKLKTAGCAVDITLNADSDELKRFKAECVERVGQDEGHQNK